MKRGFTLLEVMLALAIFALAAMAVLQIASGALSNQQILEEKTVAGWVAENQTALLYLMTREQRAVRHQGESDMAGSRWYWRTTPPRTKRIPPLSDASTQGPASNAGSRWP